jgi:hypothetical protein
VFSLPGTAPAAPSSFDSRSIHVLLHRFIVIASPLYRSSLYRSSFAVHRVIV